MSVKGLLAWTLIGLSLVLAIPALVLSFAAEKLNDIADEMD